MLSLSLFWQINIFNSKMKGQQIQALASGAIIMIILGSLYVYGGIAPYLESDLYYKGNQNITSAKLSIILTVSIITTNIGIFLSSLKKLKFNYRLMVLISIIGVSVSTYALSYMTNIYSYIFFYGICFGLFLGYGYLIPIRNCYDYLPDQKGLCSGVCMMGFGIGPVIFTMALTYLINPNNESLLPNEKYPQSVAQNVPPSLRSIAIAYLVIGLVGVILMKPKSQKQLEQDGQNQALNQNLIELQVIPESSHEKIDRKADQKHIIFEVPDDDENVNASMPSPPEQKASYLVKRKYRDMKEQRQLLLELNEQKLSKKLFLYLYKKDLHMLVVILSMSSAFGLFLTFNYKTFGFTSIKNDNYISLIGSVGNFISACFRIIWGYWYDQYSFQNITTAINICLLFSCAIVDYAVESEFAYFIIIVIVYASFGGNYSIYPPQNVKMLGKALGSRVYFVTNTGFSIGAVIQYIAMITLVEKYGRDGYTYCFIIFAGMLIMSIFYGVTIDFCSYQGQPKAKNEEIVHQNDKSPEIERSPHQNIQISP